MKKLIIKLFRFDLMQKRWGRKWMKGTYYHIDPVGLPMAPFWCDVEITSCQSRTIAKEVHL